MTEESVGAPGSPELYSTIQVTLKASLAPVKPQASISSLASRFTILFILLASIAMGAMGVDGLRQMDLPQRIGIGIILVLGGALLSVSLAWQMTPGSLQTIPANIAVPALAAGFLVGVGLLFPWHAPEAFFASGWHCFKTGMAMAAPAALLFFIMARRGAPLAIGSLGGTLGALAGLLGAAVLQFTCSRQEAAHLAVWHGGVLVASVLTGVAIAEVVRMALRHRS